MIRTLIWVGVVLALLVFVYESLDGGGVRKDAQREKSQLADKDANAPVGPMTSTVPAPATVPIPTSRNAAAAPAEESVAPATAPAAIVQARAPLVVAPGGPTVTLGADGARASGRGLSFALADASTVPVRVAHLACHGEPAPVDRPHRGSCNPYEGDTSCRTVLPIACYRSSGAAAPPNLAQDFYKGWTSGQLAATRPVMGAVLHSESDASARCEAELGAGWRMAEFHDGGGGWGLQGERGSGLRGGTRYWVHINDQRGNCWNSAP